ncbi:DUF1097 domain-containing protein [Stenotrophomonas sp. 24(2023)]|uniref:DUF1097 domain-containing protein n=1 Tax=Stenotrophomonas sp. 24(2023) TaxID=3068324 RepID=UPI0027E0363E|nr:DUF1097 domain-containing protein [Stenotrophomonas sp. 24(2023)]WMJ68948.1 DUF1097 domain-containing protein [Stenotrophomonas sp. 24(2023)]
MTTAPVSRRAYTLVTVTAALTAAFAAAGALHAGWPVWTMFIGWIAFFTRGLTTRSSVENLACVWLGLALGALAALAIATLAPVLGVPLAVPLVVLVVALAVVSLRGLPVLNNLLGYFLGLVAWFAAHLEPSLAHLAELAGASALGSLAGWVSHHVPRRLIARH